MKIINLNEIDITKIKNIKHLNCMLFNWQDQYIENTKHLDKPERIKENQSENPNSNEPESNGSNDIP